MTESEEVSASARTAERKAAADAETCIRYWDDSDVPLRHRTFAIPEGETPWHAAMAQVSGRLDQGFIFVLTGNRGTGKTQLATCLVREVCKAGRPAKYVKALDIFIALREAFRKDGDTEAAVINRFVKPSLLVIDAMEERGETAFENRLLNHIIDKRYDNRDDTLLITNQTVEAFAESVGPSIVSRIHEAGGKILCTWDSFRSRK